MLMSFEISEQLCAQFCSEEIWGGSILTAEAQPDDFDKPRRNMPQVSSDRIFDVANLYG